MRDGAGPTFPEALRRIAGARSLVALDGGPEGESCLAWGDHLQELPWRGAGDLDAGIDQWMPRSPGADEPSPLHAGWDAFPGGILVQLDYEAPAIPPQAWRPTAWASWSAGQGPQLHGDGVAVARLADELHGRPHACPPPQLLSPPSLSLSRAEHAQAVQEIRARIAAGEVYQTNLTLAQDGLLAPGENRDIGAFLALRALSPAPFAGLFRSPGRASVVSHSPESFLRCRGAAVCSSPIKGTRGRIPGREAEVRAQLLASLKDRAELTMIVDLVRHDLGRVAVAGSVQVACPARILDLDYAHHLVGEVQARLAPNQSFGALIASAFPAGSITGAPKRMAMQVISSLERGRRGAYCGTFGWISSGGCDLAVAIRTLEIDGDAVRLHSGGGIVSDSDPEAEWEELCIKSTRMLAALGQPSPGAGT